MGLLSITRSSDFSMILTWLTLSVIFYSINWSNILFVTSIGIGFHLYQLLKLRKIPGSEQWNAIIIGGGVSGLNAAKKLKEAGIEFIVLEKGSQCGGTWWFNQYPGCSCDVPSHLYSLSYFLNPWWPNAFSPHNEIKNYLFDLAKEFDILRFVKCNQNVTECQWDDERQKWTITTETGSTYEANIVISCVGILHVPSKPTFKDQEKFQGLVMHTAEWNPNVNLKGKRVAVIGTGASAIQVVPEIAKDVKQLFVFQRTPAWVLPRFNSKFSSWLQKIFSSFPPSMLLLRLYIFLKHEILFYTVFNIHRLWLNELMEKWGHFELNKVVKDPDVVKKLTPSYRIGCKRITFSDTYHQAFNLPNVDLVTDRIDSFTSKGISSRGKNFDCDVIILATGFNVIDSARTFRCVGKNGQVLADLWKDEPRSYKGTTYPGFPNMFFLLGPGTGLGHSSVIFMIECQNNYIMDALTKLVKSGHRSMDLKPEKLEAYKEMSRELMKSRVFNGELNCKAWYLNDHGVNWTLWPGSLAHFWWQTHSCDFEDYLWR